IPVPSEVLNRIPLPSLNGIKFSYLMTHTNHHNKTEPYFNCDYCNVNATVQNRIDKLPFKFQMNSIKSEFAQMYVIIDTSTLSADQIMYLPLFVEFLFNSQIRRGDEIIKIEVVKKQLLEEVYKYKKYLTYFSGMDLTLHIKVDVNNYVKGVNWLKRVINNTIFTKGRMGVYATQTVYHMDKRRKKEGKQGSLMFSDIMFRNNTIKYQTSAHQQIPFLKNLLNSLQKEPKEIINKFEVIRDQIMKPKHMSVYIAADFDKVSKHVDPFNPWMSFINTDDVDDSKILNVPKMRDLMSNRKLNNITGYIVGLQASQSSYLVKFSSAIFAAKHPDLPALRIAVKYFSIMEGPLWNGIRGNGFAYTVGLSHSFDAGVIILRILRSSNVIGAYKEAMAIIRNHIEGKSIWKVTLFESAKSNLIYGLIRSREGIDKMLLKSISDEYQQLPVYYEKYLLEQYLQVTLKDVINVTKKYLKPLMQTIDSTTLIETNTKNVNKVKSEMELMG
ncbi:unnamed protein product, partial [Meganyctiphanes norvegica]